ncbi:MAG: hypothetical protein FWF24_06155 [Alphaproteobacteria bacterium]|nr:hypothetical protein [Alphaproteobacteria bacterium]
MVKIAKGFWIKEDHPMSRFALIFAFALLFSVSAPAVAGKYDTAPDFGSAICSAKFPCAQVTDSAGEQDLLPKLINDADRCVASRLNLRAEGSYFDDTRGLDRDLCLTTRRLDRKKIGLTMEPHCCVVPVSAESPMCQLVCKKYGTR